MQYHIETERLLLKPVAPEDVSAMFIWTSDPEVNPYLSYPLHHDVSVMQKWIASLRPENLEFGFYRSEDGLLIGTGGIGKCIDGLHVGQGLCYGGGKGDAFLGTPGAGD